MVGRVVSVKSKNTATVIVERTVTHPLYKKTYIQSKKYLVDDKISVKLGDIVDFINCKPISKNKRWKIISVLGRDFVEIAKETMMEKAKEAIAEVMPASPDGGQGGPEEKIKKPSAVSLQPEKETIEKQKKPRKKKGKSES